MRCCLSSSMIGEPQVAQVHSSRGPLGFWSLNGWRFMPSGLSTFTSPCLKNTTWLDSWPVTRLHTEQWQGWLSSGSLSDDRNGVVEGKCVSVRVDLGGRRINK